MDPLLQFRALDIHLEGAPFDAALPAGWIDAALSDANLTLGVGEWEARSVPGGGRVTGRLSRSGNDIVVRAELSAAIVLACSRCLGPATVSVKSELTLLLKPAPVVADRPSGSGRQGRASNRGTGDDAEHEFTADEADLDLYDGETVVLDGFVREAILLELPQFPLCSAECSGLAAAELPVAAELEPAVDPRFAPLGALRERLGFAPASPLAASLELAEAAAPAPKPVLRASGRARPLGAGKAKKKTQRRQNKE